MPYQQMPTFKALPDKMLEVPQPGIGGLNLKDLEFEQEVNQSPYLLNVMYRNGSFTKRYGQNVHSEYDDEIYSSVYFENNIILHVGTSIYKYVQGSAPVQIATGLPRTKGLFIVYAQTLFYLITSGFYQFKNNVWSVVEPYVPDVYINCKPDGSYMDVVEDYNILGFKFNEVYNGEANITEYQVYGDEDNIIDWDVTPTITINGEETTAFTVDTAFKKITFTTPPGEGNLNVVMTFTLKNRVFSTERTQLLNCKYYDTFGGSNNSRLFLAGGGKSKYVYSEAYDVSYFPENNFTTLGNTEDDITGFGRQYNVLIVFKPKEIYSIYSFVETAMTTIVEERIGFEGFKTQLVNSRVGCDAPYSIQVINNLLTWFNSNEGICTLVSTNVQDERNVRVISRNIERTNYLGVKGILDYEENINLIQSADYDNKYFLVFPLSGNCFVWDYEISPYRYSSQGETSPSKLDWFLFDRFYVKQFLRVDKKLLYASMYKTNDIDYTNKMIELNPGLEDLDFNGDGETEAINAYYMTPLMQFGAVEYLKNLKNIFIQCRGDSYAKVDLGYMTNDSTEIEVDPEPVEVRSGSVLWQNFDWDNFTWFTNVWNNIFRRKCNLKKIQMASVLFTNNEKDSDLSITHVSFQYQIVKTIR